MHVSAAAEPAAPAVTGTVSSRRPTTPPLLEKYLSAYWLRPENALWMALRSNALSACPLHAPSADISCGDGVFSFLHAGGEFQPAFDVFQSVGGLDRVRTDNADVFDHFDDRFAPRIASPPKLKFNLGTDLKPALLAKAAALGVYQRTLVHDNEQPLPLEDASLQTIYCNSAYWVRGIEPFLCDLRRLCAPGGRIILHVKLDALQECTLHPFRDRLGDAFLAIIDRGRSQCYPSIASQSVWECRFAAAGLVIESAKPLASRAHAHIWDLGLRPIAPLLIRMAEAINPTTRAEIKSEWVALLGELLTPLFSSTLDLGRGTGQPVEIQYELTPIT